MQGYLFILASIVALGTAIYVVTARNPVYAAIGLMGFFLSVSGLYVLLKAPFLAAVQVIVYVGAILVLFLFVIMLLDLRSLEQEGVKMSGAVLAVSAMLTALIGGLAIWPVVRGLPADKGFPDVPAEFGATKAVALTAYTKYALSVELVSLLLLVAIVGSVALAKRRFDGELETEGGS